MKNKGIERLCVLRIILIMIVVICCQPSLSQGFKVKEFKQNVNDGSGFHALLDANGHPCGLIKVRTNNPDLQFFGDVVGDVENKMNEYWVYVPQGCRQLKVNHPNLLPLIILFSDYGIDISSKATYILTLEETKFKKEKTEVTIIVKPENADLYIDDVAIDNLNGNGYYQLYLPKGDHICKISKAGYGQNVQVIQTGKSVQSISVKLESVMARLEVKCKTATAEIFVDSDFKGNGVWKGEVLPGSHHIEARQKNFNSQILDVSLEEKENRVVTVPELKRSKGKLKIEVTPADVPVIIDGSYVGQSPCLIELESGTHVVLCNRDKGYGCAPYRVSYEIEAGNIKTLKVDLKIDTNDSRYPKAYQGDVNAMIQLALDRYASDEERMYWAKKIPNPTNYYNKIDINVPFDIINANRNPDYIHERAFLLALLLNPDKALEAVEKAEKAGSFSYPGRNVDYWSQLGHAFKRDRLYEKAIKCFKIACERESLDKRIQSSYWFEEDIGDCYKALGNIQKAASYYRLILNHSNEILFDTDKRRVEKKLKELGY